MVFLHLRPTSFSKSLVKFLIKEEKVHLRGQILQEYVLAFSDLELLCPSKLQSKSRSNEREEIWLSSLLVVSSASFYRPYLFMQEILSVLLFHKLCIMVSYGLLFSSSPDNTDDGLRSKPKTSGALQEDQHCCPPLILAFRLLGPCNWKINMIRY